MTVDIIKNVLMWSFIINFGILMWWFLWIWLAQGFLYRVHAKMFKISEEQFKAINYGGMGLYKLLIVVFNLVPYIALQIVV